MVRGSAVVYGGRGEITKAIFHMTYMQRYQKRYQKLPNTGLLASWTLIEG